MYLFIYFCFTFNHTFGINCDVSHVNNSIEEHGFPVRNPVFDFRVAS
jgi:hypothetical protein